jgi:hypothetical protein
VAKETKRLEAKPPVRWLCRHLYPALVTTLEGGARRAQCLRCGAQGEARMGLGEAIRALREVH